MRKKVCVFLCVKKFPLFAISILFCQMKEKIQRSEKEEEKKMNSGSKFIKYHNRGRHTCL